MLTTKLMASNLLVDIGNSTISWKIDKTYTTCLIHDFKPKLLPKYDNCFISCVAKDYLIKTFINPQIIHPQPYKNLIFDYDLTALGVDRFLVIIAALNNFPNNNLMVIDIGTFVTIDYIIDKKHISGGIVPGLFLLQNIHQFTKNDSKNAWKVGTKEMLINYLKKSIDEFVKDDSKILITGGNQKLIRMQGKYDNYFDKISYHQNLVLDGLSNIINE